MSRPRASITEVTSESKPLVTSLSHVADPTSWVTEAVDRDGVEEAGGHTVILPWHVTEVALVVVPLVPEHEAHQPLVGPA